MSENKNNVATENKTDSNSKKELEPVQVKETRILVSRLFSRTKLDKDGNPLEIGKKTHFHGREREGFTKAQLRAKLKFENPTFKSRAINELLWREWNDQALLKVRACKQWIDVQGEKGLLPVDATARSNSGSIKLAAVREPVASKSLKEDNEALTVAFQEIQGVLAEEKETVSGLNKRIAELEEKLSQQVA